MSAAARAFARVLAVLLVASGLTSLTAAPAAAVPSNDTLPGATVIDGVPYVDVMDPTGATTGALDGMACQTSNARSVWYRFSPTVTQRLSVDTARSDRAVHLVLLRRSSVGVRPVVDECSNRISDFTFEAGTTYFIMAYDQLFDEPPASRLVLRVRAPLRTSVDIDPLGTVSSATGDAVVTGTVSCSRNTTSTRVFIRVRQRINDTTIATGQGEAVTSVPCARLDPAEFSVLVEPDLFLSGAPFKAGAAGVIGTPTGCDVFECVSVTTQRAIVTLDWVA